jgi:hypothetical protein
MQQTASSEGVSHQSMVTQKISLALIHFLWGGGVSPHSPVWLRESCISWWRVISSWHLPYSLSSSQERRWGAPNLTSITERPNNVTPSRSQLHLGGSRFICTRHHPLGHKGDRTYLWGPWAPGWMQNHR